MKLRFAASLAMLLAASPACAQAPAVKAGAPKLLIVISVDQFSAALFDAYRPHFTGGLRRMADGVAFANGFQAHAGTQTCPGHAAIMTGGHPARTGVIANYWYDFAVQRGDKRIYCAEDESVAGSNSEDVSVSATHLRVPTLGDLMKQTWPTSRVIAVTGKDRTAATMGGRNPDQRWWWQGSRFVQNNAVAPAPVMAQVNGAVAKAIAEARPPLAPPAFCAGKDKSYALPDGGSVGTYRFQRNAGDAAAFGDGPERDAATLAAAAALVRAMQLGRRNTPDLLAIGLSATDLVGHQFGPGGMEMCLQLASLDKDLRDFFALLDEDGVDYAVVLTADHGSLDLPERLRVQGVADAARLDPAVTPAAIGTEIARRLQLTTPIFVGDWYLNGNVPQERRPEVLALARQLLSNQPQVHSVYTKAEIAAHPMPTSARPESWSVLDRLRASFDARRSADLAVIYKPNISTSAVAGHGSLWDYDRKVPILFWRHGIAAESRAESAMTVDIMPTLASLIGMVVPVGSVDGECLDVTAGVANNCR